MRQSITKSFETDRHRELWDRTSQIVVRQNVTGSGETEHHREWWDRTSQGVVRQYITNSGETERHREWWDRTSQRVWHRQSHRVMGQNVSGSDETMSQGLVKQNVTGSGETEQGVINLWHRVRWVWLSNVTLAGTFDVTMSGKSECYCEWLACCFTVCVSKRDLPFCSFSWFRISNGNHITNDSNNDTTTCNNTQDNGKRGHRMSGHSARRHPVCGPASGRSLQLTISWPVSETLRTLL